MTTNVKLMRRNDAINFIKFIAIILITFSHMGILFPKYGYLATGGGVGDALFFFSSGFGLYYSRPDTFINWYKRRINRIYPTIITWALLSSVMFGWEWNVIDLILAPKYWFISCIMMFYLLYYFIKKYLYKYIYILVPIPILVILVINLKATGSTQSIMSQDYMRIYSLCFMLMGSFAASSSRKYSAFKSSTLALILILMYYGCQYYCSAHPFIKPYQALSIIPLLFSTYWIYQFCSSESILLLFENKIIKIIIGFISAITLEIYLVQKALITDALNHIFPLNILIISAVILVSAYILKCISSIYMQLFNDNTFSIREIFKVKF